MMENELIDCFESQWRFARGLTRDLLEALKTSELAFSPGSHLGPFWKHFRHLGGVQENYLCALETGRIVFGFDDASYSGDASKKSLLDYLDRLDVHLRQKLITLDAARKIDWFGSPTDAYAHLMRLADHEILHQGMFVVYVRLLGRKFPSSWAPWGL
jgi:uncharacterized damage-inducible protein DinB